MATQTSITELSSSIASLARGPSDPKASPAAYGTSAAARSAPTKTALLGRAALLGARRYWAGQRYWERAAIGQGSAIGRAALLAGQRARAVIVFLMPVRSQSTLVTPVTSPLRACTLVHSAWLAQPCCWGDLAAAAMQ